MFKFGENKLGLVSGGYPTEPHTKTLFVRQVEGDVLYVRVAPVCWMRGPQVLRLGFALDENASNLETLFLDYLPVVYQMATDADIWKAIDSFVESGGMSQLRTVDEQGRERLLECYVQLKQAKEEDAKVILGFMTDARAEGYKSVLHVVVHGWGDDRVMLVKCDHANPSDEFVRGCMNELNIDTYDYTVTTL